MGCAAPVEKVEPINRVEKLTSKQERVAWVMADIFEWTGVSTPEAGQFLECLIEVTSRS